MDLTPLEPATRGESRRVGWGLRGPGSAALQIVGTGLLLAGLSWLLEPHFASSQPARLLAALQPIGAVMGVAGLVLWWACRALCRASVRRERQAPDELMWCARAWHASINPVPAPPEPPGHWGPLLLRQIAWQRFDAVVAQLYQQDGYRAQAFARGPREGLELWLHEPDRLFDPVCLVRAWHAPGEVLGADCIEEVGALLAVCVFPRVELVTSGTFSPQARRLAAERSLTLLDARDLVGRIASRTAEQQASLQATAMEGQYWRPVCHDCATPMVQRASQESGHTYWGCLGYPHCTVVQPMRRP